MTSTLDLQLLVLVCRFLAVFVVAAVLIALLGYWVECLEGLVGKLKDLELGDG